MSERKDFFSSKDPYDVLSGMTEILDKHFFGEEMSLYVPKIFNLLYSNNELLQKAALRVLSVLIQNNKDEANDHIDIILSLLNSENMKIPILRFLSIIQTDFIYNNIREQVKNLLHDKSILVKKYSLFIIFNAAKRTNYWKEDFTEAYSRAVFEKELLPLLYQMITEIYSNERVPYDNLIMSLIPEIENYDYFTFSKVCIMFSRVKGSYLIDSSQQFLISRIDNHPLHCLAALPLAKKVIPDHPIRRAIADKLMVCATEEKDENIILMCISALNQLKPNLIPPRQLAMALLTSQSANIRLTCTLMMKMLDNSLKKTFEDVLHSSIKSHDSYYLTLIMPMIPPTHSWYSSFVMILYNNDEDWTKSIAASALKIAKPEAIPDLMNEFSKFVEIPDDAFGIEAAKIISQFSEKPEDFYKLISQSILSKSEKYILNMLNDASLLWFRLQFKLEQAMKIRLSVIENACKSREIRLCASELEEIAESL